ncbi:fatty acid-binding protein, adipocyte-like [Branchiostoma floridae x Branchiostoma japonicum]
MPFNIPEGKGTWKLAKHSDNYPEIMAKMGIPPQVQQVMKDAEVTMETTVSGKTLTNKRTILGRTTENTIILGEECEEMDPNGTKRKVTCTLEGDTLVFVYPNHDGKGLEVRQTLRWEGDNTMRMEYKVGDLEGSAEMQKI